MNIKVIAALILFGLFAGGALYIRVLQGDLRALRLERDNAVFLYDHSEKDKKNAYEVAHANQMRLRALDRQYDDLKRMWDNAVCIPVTDAASGCHDAGAGAELPRCHGIVAEALLSYAREAERVRLQLIACQDYVRRYSGDIEK